MSREPEEVLDVLREVWRTQGQNHEDLDQAAGERKACKRMASVGFDVAGDDEDLRAAWRARLAREGKLNLDGGSLADLVLRPAGSSGPSGHGR
jgi:hypothetical protein